MKTRSDFVSNSSSCSFVIHNVKKAMTCFCEDCKCEFETSSFPYAIESCIVRCLKEDKDEVCKFFDTDCECETYSYNGNEFANIYCQNINSVFEKCIGNIDSHVLDKIKEISISCDDCEFEGVSWLKDMFEYFKSCGNDVVSNDESERDFDSCDSKLRSKMISMTIRRKMQNEL